MISLLLVVGMLRAGPGRIEPERPRWGSNFVVVYDPEADGAKFSSGDAVHFVAWLAYPENLSTVWGKMRLEDGVFRYELPVKESLGHIDAFFVTPSGYDPGANASSMIYRSDGVPARGAHQHRTNQENWSNLFEQETALYPKDYWEYLTKWNGARHAGDEDFPMVVARSSSARRHCRPIARARA